MEIYGHFHYCCFILSASISLYHRTKSSQRKLGITLCWNVQMTVCKFCLEAKITLICVIFNLGFGLLSVQINQLISMAGWHWDDRNAKQNFEINQVNSCCVFAILYYFIEHVEHCKKIFILNVYSLRTINSNINWIEMQKQFINQCASGSRMGRHSNEWVK